jgi:hypothetical protein
MLTPQITLQNRIVYKAFHEFKRISDDRSSLRDKDHAQRLTIQARFVAITSAGCEAQL